MKEVHRLHLAAVGNVKICTLQVGVICRWHGVLPQGFSGSSGVLPMPRGGIIFRAFQTWTYRTLPEGLTGSRHGWEPPQEFSPALPPLGLHSADGQRLGLSAGYPRVVHPPWLSGSLPAHQKLIMTAMCMETLQPREQGKVFLKWYPSPTFGLLATETASIIPPPALGACNTTQGPRLGFLVPVGPRHLLVHVVGQVPHDAHTILH